MHARKRFFRLGCLVLLGGGVSSCGWGHRAECIPTPSAALESAIEETNSNLLVGSEKWMAKDWWNLFNDSQLSQFVLTVFARNPTLQAAQANIFLALAIADRVYARLLPLVIGSADASAQKSAKQESFLLAPPMFPTHHRL